MNPQPGPSRDFEMYELIRSGYRAKEIAEMFGCNAMVVRRAIRRIEGRQRRKHVERDAA